VPHGNTLRLIFHRIQQKLRHFPSGPVIGLMAVVLLRASQDSLIPRDVGCPPPVRVYSAVLRVPLRLFRLRFANFKLRFDKCDKLRALHCNRQCRWQHLMQRNEAHVTHNGSRGDSITDSSAVTWRALVLFHYPPPADHPEVSHPTARDRHLPRIPYHAP